MMQTFISVKLYATLSNYTPASADKYPVEPRTTIRALMAQLGVPEDEVKLIFFNGVKGDPASSLKSGDRVGIFPPVGGG